MLDLITSRMPELKQLCEQYDIQTMYVFGSACTEDFNRSSDIDLLINFKDIPVERYTDNYFEMHVKLEELFGRKVDLVTERSLKNPYFIQRVEETKQLLYAA